jgi:hypothetical protein
VGELVDPVAIHEEPGVSGTDLPGVEQAALQAADDGRVDVGVAGDNARRLAAEFEAEPFQVAVSRSVHDRTADLSRASERHLVHVGVLDQCLAQITIAGEQVDRSGRHAGVDAEPGEPDRGQRCELGRLENDGISGC